MTGANINIRTDSIDVPYKPVGGFAQLGNMVRHTHLIVENNTKVANRLWWKNFSVVKIETDITKLFQIVRRRSNKKFSLVLIQFKFAFNHPMLYVCYTPGELKKVHIEHPQEY